MGAFPLVPLMGQNNSKADQHICFFHFKLNVGWEGQIYFMDDDNRYDEDLFQILRKLEPMRVGNNIL
jgi:hypothetical protein